MPDKLIKFVKLGPHHHSTGKTMHRYGDQPIETPSELRIAQYEGDPGFYLLYCDADGAELTDTYHETLEAALDQADFEFEVKAADWQDAP